MGRLDHLGEHADTEVEEASQPLAAHVLGGSHGETVEHQPQDPIVVGQGPAHDGQLAVPEAGDHANSGKVLDRIVASRQPQARHRVMFPQEAI